MGEYSIRINILFLEELFNNFDFCIFKIVAISPVYILDITITITVHIYFQGAIFLRIDFAKMFEDQIQGLSLGMMKELLEIF